MSPVNVSQRQPRSVAQKKPPALRAGGRITNDLVSVNWWPD